ncbi:MAG: class B sortase [Lachnospiraceae bacterium]|nr:class B sortase [Lachnospiraceae bacterium]
MTADELKVAGRRFRTRADYEAGLRDLTKINKIKSGTDLDDPVSIYQLYSDLLNGTYRFETAVGTDFDDEIYEKVELLKKRGITAENAAALSKGKAIAKNRASKTGKTNKQKQASLSAPKTSAKRTSVKALHEYDETMQKEILSEMKRAEKRRKGIVAVASLIALLCFGYFGIYYYQLSRTNTDYEKLSELKDNGKEHYFFSGQEQVKVHKTNQELPDILPEYKILYEKNKKLIGWLKIDDTIIDYPVMQTENNDYYLDHNFDQEYDKNGSIFLDCNCSVYPRSTNLIIYGHHMKSGSMFGNLQKYAKESYGKEHKYIQFDTIYEKGTYEVMYVFRSQVFQKDDMVFKYYQFTNANSEAEFDSYMAEMQKLSLYDMGVTAKYGDSLITLSTCDNSQTDGRFVVVARRVS